ncbi:hypothetical protein RYO59_000410 [Thermosynechococcaceae cyanobacterium Okahandja]
MKSLFKSQGFVIGCNALLLFSGLASVLAPAPARANDAAMIGIGAGLFGAALGAGLAAPRRPRNETTVIVVPPTPTATMVPVPTAPMVPVYPHSPYPPMMQTGNPMVYQVMAQNGLMPVACMPGTVMIQTISYPGYPPSPPTCAYPTPYIPAGSYYVQPQTGRLVPAVYY